MAKKINSMGVRVFFVALVSLVFGVSKGLTADWSSILKETKVKYAKFEKEVKDMTIVQEITMVTPEGERTSEAKMLRKGKKFRRESTMQMPDMPKEMGEIETITIYDGKDIWIISSLVKQKISDEERKKYQTERNWWEFLSENAEIVGTEKVGARDCYVVEIEEQKESPFTKVWLEKKNLVLVKAESREPTGEKVLLVFSDFRKIKSDWEIPYKTEMYADGKHTLTTLVKSVDINKGLSDDLFNPEKVKVKGFSMEEMMKMGEE